MHVWEEVYAYVEGMTPHPLMRNILCEHPRLTEVRRRESQPRIQRWDDMGPRVIRPQCSRDLSIA